MKSLRLLPLSLMLMATAGHAAAAKPVQVDGYTYVKSLGGIDEYRLDANDLSVLVMPSHAAPVVTFQVTYRVGSRNETTGTTGGTHMLEHLMFKGSKNFNAAAGNGVDTYLERVGAGFNATTGTDRTNYYATLGSDALEGYIAIEADRMRNLMLDDKARQGEMTVVRNEYERGENDPLSALNKQVVASAYQAHPYHHSTIGWRSDIEKIPIGKLRAFYDTFYWPNNATVSIVGDVEPAQALALVKKYYGAIPRSPQPIPAMYTEEPPQEGPRRTMLRRAGSAGGVEIAYPAVTARDADAPALVVLGLILGQDKTGRLYRALVDASIATAVSASFQLMHDPGLVDITVMMTPQAKHEDVERIVLAELRRLQSEGASPEEIRSALGPYRAADAYRRDGTDSAASALNEYIAMGDWTLYVTFLESIENVTAADVKRVAAKYLTENHSTTGWFVPEKTP